MANEQRMIDANEAIKLLRGSCVAKYPSTFLMGLFTAADEIAKLPTVDAVPVVHGRWRRRSNEMTCSKCRFIYYSNHDDFNYCPNCGAKMDGGNADANL